MNGNNPYGGCTTNFLFHSNDTRYFLGLAAHCFRTDGDPSWVPCPTDLAPIGTRVTFQSDSGSTWGGTLVYSSFTTMQRVKEADPDVCNANDFALVELDATAVPSAHPAVLFYGGPTAALVGTSLASGSAIHMYGSSSTRPGATGNAHDGTFSGYTDDGWGASASFTPPAVPGDSGSGLLGPQGQAVAVLSTIGVSVGLGGTGSSNGFSTLPYALWYMGKHEGWWPSLVTWPTFDADGI